MKFEFWTTSGHSHLKAILEPNDSVLGSREEGMGTKIELIQNVVNFDYEVSEIHPDVLGLLCLVTFFPFIGSEVEFPAPVSIRLYKAFQNKCFTNKKQIKFRNISQDVPLYEGDKVALSFGGGIDSTAVRQMFPEAFVIHEAHIRNNELVPCQSHSVVEKLQPDRGRVVKTNIRYLSKPGGWHTWPCSTSTSLLMATDLRVGLILAGSNLGSSFLANGTRFWDRIKARAWHGPSGNYWESAFHHIGLPMSSPVIGVSEMQAMNLSKHFLDNDEVVYCMEKDGSACNVCTKCFRRDVIRTYLFDDHQVDWESYNTSLIKSLLQKRPLYFGHIFSSAFSLKKERFPDWILNLVKDVRPINSDWTMRVFTDSFVLFSENWRGFLSERILQYIEPMSEKDVAELKSWDQTSS